MRWATGRNVALAATLLVTLLAAVPGRAGAADARQAYQQAQEQVAAGDLAAVRKSMIAAVKLDRANQRYLQQYLLITQALKLEAEFKQQRDPKRWESAAQSLSLFYSSQGHHAQALPVDEALFARLKTADAAVQLAETLLAVENYARAVEVIRSLPDQQVSTASTALLSIALARQGDLSAARETVGRLRVERESDPFALYVAARAQAAIGQDAESLKTLVLCYEAVPPSRLAALKSHTRQCSEFAGLAATAGFAQALQTQSKAPESKCSGGSSCATCPMRGNCSHDK